MLIAWLANAGRSKRYSDALWKFNFIGAFVLIFAALDIINPFPFLSTQISPAISMKISSVVLIVAVAVGATLATITTKKKTKDGNEETFSQTTLDELRGDALKNLRLMTLLPIVVQFWILVATDQLASLGQIFTIGLFILSGPASWQFAIRVMIFSKERRDGLKSVGICGILLLAATILGTSFGLLIRDQIGLFDTKILPYLVSFTLIIVPYSFFYSHWGDKWKDERPLGTIGGLIVFTLFSSISIADQATRFFVLLLAWFVLLMLPYILYSQEFVREEFKCIKCAKEGVSPKYRLIRGDKICLNCRNSVPLERALVEDNPSLRSRINLLFLALFLKPSPRDITILIEPAKKQYVPGEEVKVVVSVAHKAKFARDHPIQCNVVLEPKFQKMKMIAEDSETQLVQPDKSGTFFFNWTIPAALEAEVPRPKEELTLVANVRITGYKPKGDRDLMNFPMVFITRQKATVKVSMAKEGRV